MKTVFSMEELAQLSNTSSASELYKKIAPKVSSIIKEQIQQ